MLSLFLCYSNCLLRISSNQHVLWQQVKQFHQVFLHFDSQEVSILLTGGGYKKIWWYWSLLVDGRHIDYVCLHKGCNISSSVTILFLVTTQSVKNVSSTVFILSFGSDYFKCFNKTTKSCCGFLCWTVVYLFIYTFFMLYHLLKGECVNHTY